MLDTYSFHPSLVLRAAARPFTLAIDEASLRVALQEESFREALYLASPTLHAECDKWQRGQIQDARKIGRLRAALARYYVRYTSRFTPFGLFAGCALVQWGEKSAVELRHEGLGRHTRLDMHYVCALAQHLAAHAEIRGRLRYWPNSSLCALGRELRYVERQYHSGEGSHQVCALPASELLEQVLLQAQKGSTPAELVAAVLEDEADREALTAYVQELIEAQVLVSELEPTVTGEEFFDYLLATLRRLSAAAPQAVGLRQAAQTLEQVQGALRMLDAAPANAAAAYERISAWLTPLGVEVEAGKLFQTDAVLDVSASFHPEGPTISQQLQEPLREALTVLSYLTPLPSLGRLEEFIRRFAARYEEQEVPLLEALDVESGLPYSPFGHAHHSNLIHDLTFPDAALESAPAQPTQAQQWWERTMRQAARTQAYAVDVREQDLCATGVPPGGGELPPSLAVLFRVLEDQQVLLESVGGSSAVNLLGRFAHATPGVQALIQAVTEHEQHHNPVVDLAEITHLPSSRVGNLLQRPHFRAYEIPYLAQSTQPAGQQLPVQELLLSVRDGRLVLRSSRTGRRIIPRLSTAHNYGEGALPVYQLLCDLQVQDLQPQLTLPADPVTAEGKFTPRFTCGIVILRAATWQLPAADYGCLLSCGPAEWTRAFAAFRAQWLLPRLFVLADGDNELLVDAENELLVGIWLDLIRLRERIVLKEFLFNPGQGPVREKQEAYVSQCLALLLRQGPSYQPGPHPAAVPALPLQRDFMPGSEWLYYKLYCGPVLADRLLVDCLLPLATELLAHGWIDRWFFVRYADPDPHLRVRWHLTPAARLDDLVRTITRHLAPVSSPQGVWRIQVDTYRRELERYGHRTMESSEALFFHQSRTLLERKARSPHLPGLPEELWLWGLQQIDELLSAFALELDHKLRFAAGLSAAFAQEFSVGKAVKQQLDAKYRRHRRDIEQWLDPATAGECPPAVLELAHRIRGCEAAGELEVQLDQLLGSYVHMLLNRLLPADARLHELVLYDFLHRHYQSCWARRQKHLISCRS